MQSCFEYHHQQHHHHPQGSPHVTFRRYSPHSASPPQPIKEEEPSGALTTASPASGSGGGPAVSSGGGGGGFYGSQHCYLPATKKVESLPRLGMLGGSTPGMYSEALVWSPAPDTHGKLPGIPSSANTGSLSPSSGLAQWMSMMSDHVPNSPHEMHYLFNGVEPSMSPTTSGSTFAVCSFMGRGPSRFKVPPTSRHYLQSPLRNLESNSGAWPSKPH